MREKNKQRTLVNRRIREKQVVRLAHVFLDIAAHELPSLAGKERKADLAFELAGGQEQSDFHPAADLVEELLVRLEPSNALQVAELLSIVTL